jgi:hypothetical protein
MADQTEQMVLVARLVDQVSDKLAQINKAMLATSAAAKRSHGVAAEAAHGHSRAIEALKKSMEGIEDVIRTATEPALGALGISALSAAGIFAGVVASVKSLGESGLEIEKVTRRTKLQADTVRELQMVGERWGVSVAQTNAALSSFGDLMEQTNRNAPQALERWKQWPQLYKALGDGLKGLNTQQGLDRVFSLLGKMSSIDQKRRALQLLGLPQDLAYYNAQELEEARAEARKWTALHPFSAEKAKAADEAWKKMDRAFQGVKEDMAIAFGPSVTRGLEAFDNWLSKPENVEKMKVAFRDLAGKVGEVVSSLGTLWGWLEKIAKWMGETQQAGIKMREQTFADPAEVVKRMQRGEPPHPLERAPNLSPHVGGKGAQELPGQQTGFALWEDINKLFKDSAGKNPRYGLAGGAASILPQSEIKRGVEDPVKKGTTEGVLDAFTQWFGAKAEGGGGGIGAQVGAGGQGGQGALTAGIGGFRPARGTGGGSAGGSTQGPPGFTGPFEPFKFDPKDAEAGGVDRSRYASDLQNPEIVARLASMIKGEVGLGGKGSLAKQIIQLESLFNRAGARNYAHLYQDLFHGKGGYYASGSFPAVSPAEVEWFKNNVLAPVMKGSDVGTKFLGRTVTGNASQLGFAGRRLQQGYYSAGRWWGDKPGKDEMFVQEQSDAKRLAEHPLPRVGPRITIRPLQSPSAANRGAYKEGADRSANLTIDFANLPRGVQTSVDHEGFKSAKVNRGFALPQANEGQDK